MMDSRERFADNVKRLRREASLTQEELAEKSGLHRTYVGGIEQQSRNVSLNVLDSFADVFGVEPAELLLPEGWDDRRSDIRNSSRWNDRLEAVSAYLSQGKGSEDGESWEYAICHREGDEIVIDPIDVRNEDLTIRILCSLAKSGCEDLAREYDNIIDLIEDYVADDSGRGVASSS